MTTILTLSGRGVTLNPAFIRSFDSFLSVTLPAAIREDAVRRDREHRIRCERIIRRLDSLKVTTPDERDPFDIETDAMFDALRLS